MPGRWIPVWVAVPGTGSPIGVGTGTARTARPDAHGPGPPNVLVVRSMGTAGTREKQLQSALAHYVTVRKQHKTCQFVRFPNLGTAGTAGNMRVRHFMYLRIRAH